MRDTKLYALNIRVSKVIRFLALNRHSEHYSMKNILVCEEM